MLTYEKFVIITKALIIQICTKKERNNISQKVIYDKESYKE